MNEMNETPETQGTPETQSTPETQQAEGQQAPTSPTSTEASMPLTFADMKLDPSIQQALDEMCYEAPMEVQSVVYDRFMQGRDLLVQSRTGSGKIIRYKLKELLTAQRPRHAGS